MSWYVIDVEADGPVPGVHSMVSFAAVKVTPSLSETFYGEVAPISKVFVPEALAVSKVTREQHCAFAAPELVIPQFKEWVLKTTNDRPVFVSDNPAFDFQWLNYYLWTYTGGNVFGHSARRVGDIYSGLIKDVYKGGDFRKFGKTPHTHHPLDDAKRVAEALQGFAAQHNLRIPTK